MLESRAVWPIEVEKSGRFYILPLLPGLQKYFYYFCNTLDVSSSKYEVSTRPRCTEVYTTTLQRSLCRAFSHADGMAASTFWKR